MTETLSRPDVEPIDQADGYAPEEIDVTGAEAPISPMADRIEHAANRINGFLRGRAEQKQLEFNQDEAYASYEDNIDTTKTRERAERNELVKRKIKGFGRSALSRMKNAGLITIGVGVIASEKAGDAMMNGFAKVDTGLDAIGSKIDTVAANYQTRSLNRENAKIERASEKQLAKESKQLEKSERVEIKIKAREDARFERSMRKKAALERRAARREKWSNRISSAKEYVTAIPTKAGDAMMNGFAKLDKGLDWTGDTMQAAKDATSERIERTRKKARVAKIAGKMAVQTYRDTKEAFKSA